MTLRDEIRDAINRCSAENGSDTPDFVLADMLVAVLAAFDAATKARDGYYEIAPLPGRTATEMIREGERRANHAFVDSGQTARGVYGNDVPLCSVCDQSPAYAGHIAPGPTE